MGRRPTDAGGAELVRHVGDGATEEDLARPAVEVRGGVLVYRAPTRQLSLRVDWTTEGGPAHAVFAVIDADRWVAALANAR